MTEREPIETWDDDSPSGVSGVQQDDGGRDDDGPRRSRSDGWQPRSERQRDGGEGQRQDQAEEPQDWGDRDDFEGDDAQGYDDDQGGDENDQSDDGQQQGGRRRGSGNAFEDRLNRLHAGPDFSGGGFGVGFVPPGYTNGQGQQQQPQQRQRGEQQQQQTKRAIIADESVRFLAEKMGMDEADVRKHLVDQVAAHLSAQFDDERRVREEEREEQGKERAWNHANSVLDDISGEAGTADLFGSNIRRANAVQAATRRYAFKIAGQFMSYRASIQMPVSEDDAMAYAIDEVRRQQANRRRGGGGNGNGGQRGGDNRNRGGQQQRGDGRGDGRSFRDPGSGRFVSSGDPQADAVNNLRGTVQRRSRQLSINPNQRGGRGAADRTPAQGNRKAAIAAVEAAKRKHRRR